MIYNPIFNPIYLNNQLDKYNVNQILDINDKLSIIKNWKSGIDDKSIYTFSEKELQGTFLNNFFDKILGYNSLPFNNEFYLIPEQSTKLDASKPDATLGYFSSTERDVRVVVELKDANCDLETKQKRLNDNRTPVEQAFSYAPKYGSKCKWVIVSNFVEIRLYLASNMLSYERFYINSLTDEKQFLKFYYILNRNNLINKISDSTIDKLYETNFEEEQKITNDFYKSFKNIRSIIIKDIIENNTNIDPIIIIEKAQKLLDRIIFICFCRDSSEELLPYDVLNKAFNPFLNSLWENLKLLFKAIDEGNLKFHIHKFNGGLFKADPVFDSLKISDDAIQKLSEIIKFNYSTELNVNILGHIFEQGISDIEQLKNLYGKKVNSLSINIRKKDGVYYTPEHITRYIVHHSIDTWLEDKKTELGYYNLPFLSMQEKLKALELLGKKYKCHKKETENDIIIKKYKMNLDFWERYREALLNIKIVDISCGSGAFLNQAFSYLYNEAKKINAEINNLYNGQEKYFNVENDFYQELDKNILQNNIFGIDINKESVDITRLSLWLSTANKHKCLATLDDNIICRDSILYDEKNANEVNFCWNNRFKAVMDSGGFDIVIGNPPYVDSEQMTKSLPYVREFCRNHYEAAKRNWDMFIPFIERGLNILTDNGILCYIVPNKLIGANYSKEIRNIMSGYSILHFKDYYGIKVFDDADIYPIVFSVKKSKKKDPVSIQLFNKSSNKWLENIVSQKLFYRDIYWDRYFVKDPKIVNIIEKMLRFTSLNDIATVKEAATVAEAYKIKDYLFDYDNKEDIKGSYKKLINTGAIDPYKSLWGIKSTKYIKASYLHPIVLNKDLLLLSELRNTDSNSDKIIIAGMSKTLECYYDNGQYLAGKSTCIVLNSSIDLRFILALLNSKLISFFYKYYFKSTALSGGYFNIRANQLKEIPIAYKESVSEQIIKEVLKIIDSNTNCKNTELFKRNIDNLVYSLYGLNMNDIYIVENDY